MQAQTLQLGSYPQILDPISNNAPEQENNNASDTQNFTVCIRVRPLNNKELNKSNPRKHSNVIKIQENMVIVVDPDVAADAGYRRDKMYLFDDVFDDTHDTASVFMQSMLPLLDNALTGYNATLFAYGMTGAGKSHTLFGELDPQTLLIQQPGLIFLTLEELFKKIHSPAYSEYEFTVKISYLEIYNEQVKDLIKGDDQNLMILEDPERGVCVADLTETPVATRNEVMQIIFSGNAKRTMASTAANTFSSRSHAIVQVLIERREKTVGLKGTVLQSKLSLIDLAGSERAAVTENRGIRMLEGANINRSLLALGNCINILSDTNKKGAFVPYRDSKLTRLLKDSLGGNTKTIMIACISPSYMCYEETVNTLKYASRAKNIKRKLHQNVKEVELHVSQYKEIIENLKAEIDTLKGQLKTKGHEENAPISHRNKLMIAAVEPVQQDIEEEEKKIEEASHRIFENLEQNWEINQTLRELNDLEMQNRETLKNLYKHLESTSEDDKVYREQILRQIETLKATMDSNERIKREIAHTLQGNLLENRNLKDQLVEFASSVDTLEDIELARKLLDIDRLDIITQNTEIKKEALNLAKTRVQQNKQISQMEEEMRMMRLMLEEKERLLANNHQLIQNLRSKISEKNAPVSSEVEEIPARNESMPVFQGADISNISIKEDKNEQKTSVLKSLLMNLEKKITKSLHELDTKILPSHEHDLEDSEMLETIRTLEQQSDRQQARIGSEKVKTFEEYNQERKERPLSQNTGQNSVIVHDIDDDNEEEEQKGTETGRTMPQPSSSRRSLHEGVLSYAQNTARTNSEGFQKINLYGGANNTARSRASDASPANPLIASRLKLPIKGLSTGVLETSNRHDNTENTITTMNYGDFEDISSAKNLKKFDGALNLDSVDHNNVSRPYQSHELKHIHSGDPNVWSSSSIPTIDDGIRTPGYMIQDGYASKHTVHVPTVGDSSEWNLRRQSFQQLFKGKMREQSVGSIRNTVAVNQFPRPEHSRQSNSILGVLKDRCFESVIGLEGGFQNDSLNLDRRGGLEIRSLGQERENLKLFRSRLNNLASINSKKLSKEIVEQIKELIEEYRIKKYILSVKDQDQLRLLGESIMNHEVKVTETRQKRSGSVKEETKKARSSSVRGPNVLKENKGRSYAQRSKERKPSTQIETEQQPPKRNSVKVLAQGVLSNLHTNYAQTVNKLAPGYGGRPESAKGRGNQSNPQTPLQKKELKEREGNVGESKKVGVNLLHMFENQPKGYSKSNKARESARDQSRLANDEKVNL